MKFTKSVKRGEHQDSFAGPLVDIVSALYYLSFLSCGRLVLRMFFFVVVAVIVMCDILLLLCLTCPKKSIKKNMVATLRITLVHQCNHKHPHFPFSFQWATTVKDNEG